jgi:hypothetical protein
MAVYFKELNYQINMMDFENDWKSYYYEFGILFSLLDITKECIKKTSHPFKNDALNPLYNFDFDKYITCDDNNVINHFFYESENFISILRCLIIAHPINSNKSFDNKTEYFSLNEICVDSDSEIFKSLMPNKVHAKRDHIRLKIQKYCLDEEETIESLFSVLINNVFIRKYYKYITDFLYSYLSTFNTKDESDLKRNQELLNELYGESNLYKKLNIIRKGIMREYKNDVDLGYIPFDIRFIDTVFKVKNDFVCDYLVKTFIFNLKNNNYYECIDLRLYEKESKDYKWTTYWFEEVDFNDVFSFENAVIDAKNYNIKMKNERFTYYFLRFLFNVFSFEEIKSCKSYFDILSKIIKKELELRDLTSRK